MSHFKYHVFFCTNQREGGESCCNDHGAADVRDYMKKRVKELGEKIPDRVRINTAGCLDRCDKGPVIVVYPEATWYTYVDREDVDEIIESHLIGGKAVGRLKID
jgi:(2Fe-2S) ferredoxin